jgi:hypothetical protein
MNPQTLYLRIVSIIWRKQFRLFASNDLSDAHVADSAIVVSGGDELVSSWRVVVTNFRFHGGFYANCVSLAG